MTEIPDDKHSKKPTKQELRWLHFILEGKDARAAGKLAGMPAPKAKKSAGWVQTTRERSAKPYLYDLWRHFIDRQLRILEASNANIMREISLIAFSSIDRFIEFPSRKDAEDKKKLDELRIGEYKPGSFIKLKYVEDIPAELIPAIAEINETKEGIRIKLHSKMDALDMLAKIMKLYNREPASEVPFEGVINIHVHGSHSPLLLNGHNGAAKGDLENTKP